jgi:hypothetical protein
MKNSQPVLDADQVLTLLLDAVSELPGYFVYVDSQEGYAEDGAHFDVSGWLLATCRAAAVSPGKIKESDLTALLAMSADERREQWSMPIKLSSIQSDDITETVTIDFGKDGDLNIAVVPNRFTKGFQRQLRAAINDEDETALMDLFFTIVKDWDLLGPNSKKLPVTPETTDQLGMVVIADIMKKVQETILPKAETSNA